MTRIMIIQFKAFDRGHLSASDKVEIKQMIQNGSLKSETKRKSYELALGNGDRKHLGVKATVQITNKSNSEKTVSTCTIYES